MKKWLTIPIEPQIPLHWAKTLHIPELILILLWQRGITSIEEVNMFLSPKLQYLAHPKHWHGIQDAVKLLSSAIEQNQPIIVWGDYDVDGVTGSTVIREVLAFHQAQVIVHLPDRKEEGYGVNIPVIEQLAIDYPKALLITVDCGISDVKAISRARELGFTIIISDHHLPPTSLPPAHVVCNPRIGENPCSYLAGVGIAFFLMAALNSKQAEQTGQRMDIRDILDLVALGTLADMAMLSGQNRILVKNGLLKINEANRPGIAALKIVSGFSPLTPLGAGQVTFHLAPRINAAGRLSNPRIAHEMLYTNSKDLALKHATILNRINEERRNEEEYIFNAALEQAYSESQRQGLVLHGPDWHQGVLGIVASRITEAVHKPVLVLCTDGKMLKGSGRSIAGFDLYHGLSQCADLFERFGGHKQAAGLTLPPEHLNILKERFDTIVRNFFGDAPIIPTIHIDMELPFTQATDLTILKSLELLQPFGIGNPEPIFSSLPLCIKCYKIFGKHKEHLSMTVVEEDSGISLQAKGWKLAKYISSALQNTRIQLAYTPSLNFFNGIGSIELEIKDWIEL